MSGRHTAGIEPDVKDLLGVVLVRQAVEVSGNWYYPVSRVSSYQVERRDRMKTHWEHPT